MSVSSIVQVYLLLTIVFFGVSGIAAMREIKARSDFKATLFGGTINVYRYYRHIKRNDERVSFRFRLFLLAHINFALCLIVFAIVMLPLLIVR